MRRTKIVATLGPATDKPGKIEAIIRAGVDVVRLNFSHGSPEDHRQRAEQVRAEAARQGRTVGVLGDLQGPKIRIDRFAEGKVFLEEGAPFVLDAELDRDAGDLTRVGLTYKSLPNDVSAGDVLLLDDGRLVLEVVRVEGAQIHTRVVVGGELSNNKGINRLGGGLSAEALTDKDRADIRTAAEIGVDYLAVSFPRCAEDMHETRRLLKEAGGDAALVAKIERAEAIEPGVIDEIILASEVIMIARGDLGVEIGDAELPGVQKDLIQKARSMNRVVITATQMMESMIVNPIPTRAEVFDVANAVLDGTDAVMLSGETAAGKYPAKVVKAMGRFCEAAEKRRAARESEHRMDSRFEFVDEAIAMATMYTANHLGVRAIAAMTESGSTALWMSRISSGIPIYGLTRQERTGRKMALYRGVYPMAFETMQASHAEANRQAIQLLLEQGAISEGDLVIFTKGDMMGVHGGTNAMKILRVGDPLPADGA
ncbi:pyruvate kinase [Acidihalobacter ferrooxydans]|uniref:Pyruvate kinase n=1 Tax=Acidihalobacter ferrooxydans TaxID=1765967 RepID=A0A1P8UKB2_9GAMM|nr:pyruvate kinase [Acidihalobacter ferrooxydans]APZ44270.1 pyruvate kinase [Acidihalobacter ferrooxydans]